MLRHSGLVLRNSAMGGPAKIASIICPAGFNHMAPPWTYFARLEAIRGDDAAIAREKERLDKEIKTISSEIKARLTPQVVPSLIWVLSIREIERIQPIVGIAVSDLSGHARYLRGLCAAVPFTSTVPTADASPDGLLEMCDRLWQSMFFREMIDGLRSNVQFDEVRRKREIAALTGLLGAVQGDLRSTIQAGERVFRLFGPFSDEIILPTLGITVADAVSGFRAVRSIVEQRLNEWREHVAPVHSLYRKYQSGPVGQSIEEFLAQNAGAKKSFMDMKKGMDAADRLFTFGPQDLAGALAEHGRAFLDSFSYTPGSVNREFSTPFDCDQTLGRPFAHIADDTFMLVNACYCDFAPLHRFADCFKEQRNFDRLNRRKADSLEDEAARLFGDVIGPDQIVQNYYIPAGPSAGEAERDLLIVKGRTLFVIECKARPLRPVAQRSDKLQRILTDVERAIQEGYDQAVSTISYVRSQTGEVFISESPKAGTARSLRIKSAEIEQMIPIVLLDGYYGFIATDLKPWLAVDRKVGFPWVVDRDTLETIFLKITTFELLVPYLNWRRASHGVFNNEDEAVFAGYFMRHGAALPPPSADLVRLDPQYADIFVAEYFERQGIPVEVPPLEKGPPVWTSAERSGDFLEVREGGKLRQRINLRTGSSDTVDAYGGARSRTKVGRNDQCPCGSGRKYKICCLRLHPR
jgi:hypothetical protein